KITLCLTLCAVFLIAFVEAKPGKGNRTNWTKSSTGMNVEDPPSMEECTATCNAKTTLYTSAGCEYVCKKMIG
ncbi:hypothetical protein PTQ20_15460, partial [Clostridium perfringens]|nr:hypothetical protein [Clostridium perfringens]